MRVSINGQEVIGEAKDIAEVLGCFNPKQQSAANRVKVPVKDTLEDALTESRKLRKALTKDPSFNPHGGVVASAEPLPLPGMQPTVERAYAAETDTGIQYE